MDAQIIEYLAGIGENIHQMRDRRALIAPDVRHARLQQSLGHGEDGLAFEYFAGPEPQRLNFPRE